MERFLRQTQLEKEPLSPSILPQALGKSLDQAVGEQGGKIWEKHRKKGQRLLVVQGLEWEELGGWGEHKGGIGLRQNKKEATATRQKTDSIFLHC